MKAEITFKSDGSFKVSLFHETEAEKQILKRMSEADLLGCHYYMPSLSYQVSEMLTIYPVKKENEAE